MSESVRIAADHPAAGEAVWRAALDDLEALIERQRCVLNEGGPVDAAALAGLFFAPPDDLPPLPSALEGRARRLLTATRALAARARELSELTRPSGPAVSQPGERRRAATFDRRA